MGRTEHFFHGTRAPLGVGDQLLPTSQTGAEPNHEISYKHSVYMVPGDEKEAWNWAQAGYRSDSSGRVARSWVGRVEPQGEVHGDHEYSAEATAPSAKILERHDIMPGRQGTFPSINWNQFAKSQYSSGMNHPSDADIMGGHDAFARKYRPGLFDPPEPDLNSPERRFEYDPADPDPGQGRLF